MSVRIFPCYRCPLRAGCDQHSALSKRVAGLGLRAAAFSCDRLEKEVRPGRRIVIRQPVAVETPDGWHPEVHISMREVAATITSTSRHYRFACTVDRGAVGDVEFEEDAQDKKRFRKTQAHYRIVRFLDEPDGTLCRSGNVVRNGACDHLEGECPCKQEADFSESISLHCDVIALSQSGGVEYYYD